MTKQSTLKAIHHSHKVIGLAKGLINLKLLTVTSPARFELMPDLLTSDPAKREIILRNLWIYATIGLDLHPDHILEVFDVETGMLIASVSRAKVTIENSFTL